MASQRNYGVLVLHMMFFLVVSHYCHAQGLKSNFYKKTCPGMESVVQKTTARLISKAPTLAAPLLRMHFHDCFVRGCDGSVLLNSTSNNQAEKDAIPNLSLRGFQVIDAVKSEVEKKCPGVVSCADILALVARDAVTMLNGPFWKVPLGRRDGRVSNMLEALNDLPPPFGNISTLTTMFASKGLNKKDLVVLSGGHTIGTSHCPPFTDRLYNFTGRGDTDPTMDPNYVATLKKKCRPGDSTTLVEINPGSFKTFDGKYFTDVAKRRGLFQSDAALLNDKQTRRYVVRQVATGGATFFKDFAKSMVKMGKIGVLTGKNEASRSLMHAAKAALEVACPGVVSCADILALVARDAVTMINGPYWAVPLGRRDGVVSLSSEALNGLPAPFANISDLKSTFGALGLSVKDLAVLSGGHTIGISHCPPFSDRLYNFTGDGDTDPSMDQAYIQQLKAKCLPADVTTTVEMDPGSYFTAVSARKGLFQSDAALLNDAETKAYVQQQTNSATSTFLKDFAASMVKMGQIGVLTGNAGEIRKNCALIN
nr:peroxidase 27-like [Ipomoea batatas]